MRQGGQNSRRSRGRGSNNNNNGGGGGGGGGGNNRRQNVPMRHQNFDSNGPDVRIRGNAWQVHEKYQTLARDAATSGDRVMAENYLQHAEHYFRIIAQIQEAENRQRGPQNGANSANGANGHNGNGQQHTQGQSDDGDDDDGDGDMDGDDRPMLNG